MMRDGLLTSNVLDRPEVQREKQDDCHEASDELVCIPTAEKVDHKCKAPEDQVEKCYDRMLQSSGRGLFETFEGAVVHEWTRARTHVGSVIITNCLQNRVF